MACSLLISSRPKWAQPFFGGLDKMYVTHRRTSTAAKKNPRLKAHIRFSAVDGSLTVDEITKNAAGPISGYHVYMCGPLPMVQAFEGKFLGLGVPAKNIHFEEFNFR